MTPGPGSRLIAFDRCAYQIGEPWRGRWHRARKVSWNYRHADRSLFEAAEAEWLDVLIRGPEPSLASLEFELDRVLNAPGAPWFPEPIDTFEAEGAAWLVVADPHAGPVTDAEEASALVEFLQANGLTIDRVDRDDFASDRDGRLFFFATDRIREATGDGEGLRAKVAGALAPLRGESGSPSPLGGEGRPEGPGVRDRPRSSFGD